MSTRAISKSGEKRMKNIRELRDAQSSPLFPFLGLGVQLGTENRLYAVVEVLQRIPEKAYRSLCDRFDEFEWFIPVEELGGMVRDFPCTMPETKKNVAMARVLYLGPVLESRPFQVVVATVAHELAHIFLNHKTLINAADYGRQEQETWRTIRTWGFRKEERALVKFHKALEQEEQRELAKLRKISLINTFQSVQNRSKRIPARYLAP
jgi:hypothetical protein